MTNAGLADQQNGLTDEQRHITRMTVLKVFAIIAIVSLVLRIVYAGHLYEDDGLWFTAAEEVVRGKALYREIYFDKPPGLALVYAVLFWIFGAHIITIRLFTIAYSVAIAAVLYLFAAWLYDKRTGLLGAAMFAVFSTTYATGHTQSLNTDVLMVLPYTAGAYLLVRSQWQSRNQAWLAWAGGALVGVAFQINPKGVFDLIFFAAFLIVSRSWPLLEVDPDAGATNRSTTTSRSVLRLFGLAIVGFATCASPFLAYIAATRSLGQYWLYVWDWGSRYGSYYGATKTVLSALTRSADYLTLNNTLLIALVFLIVCTIRHRASARRRESVEGRKWAPGACFREDAMHRADAALLIWFAISYLGVMLGGRFFAHYFIQLLPSLCLIGARGLTEIFLSLRGRSLFFRRAAIGIIVLGFAFTMVRFHGRGILLAADLVRGTTSRSNAGWYYNVRNGEERRVAAVARELPDGADSSDRLGLEAIRASGPRTRAAEGRTDYLFVWGYRPEIYCWAGLLPASRYLSTQPLTGVPADIHYFGDDYRSLLDEAVTAEARAQLVRDLEETQPKYIIDEIGFFNGHLAMLEYPELGEVMSKYKSIGETGRFLVYVRKELTKKYLLRHEADTR